MKHPPEPLNPYESTPREPSWETPARSEQHGPGKCCPACGSTNMAPDMLTHSKPSVLYFILFGWIFLLFRTAFSKRSYRCEDCGAMNQYRTAGSILAMALLVLIVVFVTLSIVLPPA